MSNPVDTIAESIQETSKDFRFPLTIGSRIRGEEKFTAMIKTVVEQNDRFLIDSSNMRSLLQKVDYYKRI